MAAAARPTIGKGRHQVGPFQALDHAFAVESDDAAVVAWLGSLFAGFEAAVGPARSYVLERPADGGAVVLRFDGEIIVEAVDPAHAVAMLLWHVNRQVVAVSGDLVRLHAAGVARNGLAVVLPAPQESGKSTLTAGLIRHGFDYLSDEVVGIDPGSGRVHAYPKALSVDVGSQGVLAGLRPQLPAHVAGWAPSQWQVPATSIRADSVVRTARPRWLVTPRYVPGSETTLRPLSRADALVAAVSCTFELGVGGRRDVLALGRLVRDAHCFSLTVGDLDTACALVAGLVAAATPSGRTPT